MYAPPALGLVVLQTEWPQPAPPGWFTQALLTKDGPQGPSEGQAWESVTEPNLGPLSALSSDPPY